ncbi:MAG TPA: sugar transferase [Lunatimonas sp.]|nr:sugar transferase [Lunatimonas sp.]
MYTHFFKRLLDFLIALISIVILSPLLLAISIALMVQNGRSAFFVQERPGYQRKPFYIIKFKTMNDGRDAEGKLLPDVHRLTPLGRMIRQLSLDELPQLFNVLMGDMSLVGPRPLLYKYMPLYNEEQLRRHDVRPGITGWAQVNGRNSITWTRKFELDVYYVDNLSFDLDIEILWLTALKVIKREGINQSAERPMQPFNGEN